MKRSYNNQSNTTEQKISKKLKKSRTGEDIHETRIRTTSSEVIYSKSKSHSSVTHIGYGKKYVLTRAEIVKTEMDKLIDKCRR